MASLRLQRLIPQHFFSKAVNVLSHCQLTWFKNWAIRRYIRQYQIDMSEALVQNLDAYENLNAFFIRQLRPECRPIDRSERSIVSPVDGVIQQLGRISKDSDLLSVKGQTYSLEILLGQQSELAATFRSGAFINIYLAPKDYHRVHFPFAANLKETWSLPGDLYAVNPQTVDELPDLFARNERVCCLFETEFGPMLVVLVGAMIVSGISLVWSGLETPNTSRRIEHRDYRSTTNAIHYEKGDELGFFAFGSTVILCFPEQPAVTWANHLHVGDAVKFGQSIGSF